MQWLSFTADKDAEFRVYGFGLGFRGSGLGTPESRRSS